jgi:hypothetical protein
MGIAHEKAYYAQPAGVTDPGEYAGLLDNLPRDLGALVQVVQGLIIHVFWASLREHYDRDPRWKVPPRIHGYTKFGIGEVVLSV